MYELKCTIPLNFSILVCNFIAFLDIKSFGHCSQQKMSSLWTVFFVISELFFGGNFFVTLTAYAFWQFMNFSMNIQLLIVMKLLIAGDTILDFLDILLFIFVFLCKQVFFIWSPANGIYSRLVKKSVETRKNIFKKIKSFIKFQNFRCFSYQYECIMNEECWIVDVWPEPKLS